MHPRPRSDFLPINIQLKQKEHTSYYYIYRQVNKSMVPPSATLSSLLQQNTSTTVLFYLRIIFYILVAWKLIQIVFKKNRKLNTRERILRKFLFTHGELMKKSDEQEVEIMQLTLANTLRNATQPMRSLNTRKRFKKLKSVSFTFENNKYYDPPKFQPHFSENSDSKLIHVANQEKEQNVERVLQHIEVNIYGERTPLVKEFEENQLCSANHALKGREIQRKEEILI